MIKLSRLTDYGVVVMSQMAQDMAVTRTAPELAAASGVPAPTVAKLLKLLVKGGLVESWRGVNGGYALTRRIDEITAADIIEALEGPVALTACVDGSDADCAVESLCPMRGGWEKVNRAIRAALEEVTLAELSQPVDFLLPPTTADANVHESARRD
jgi:FeS assembly SUF system regulator